MSEENVACRADEFLQALKEEYDIVRGQGLGILKKNGRRSELQC